MLLGRGPTVALDEADHDVGAPLLAALALAPASRRSCRRRPPRPDRSGNAPPPRPSRCPIGLDASHRTWSTSAHASTSSTPVIAASTERIVIRGHPVASQLSWPAPRSAAGRRCSCSRGSRAGAVVLLAISLRRPKRTDRWPLTTIGIWTMASCGVMSGSSPLPDVVTRSGVGSTPSLCQ